MSRHGGDLDQVARRWPASGALIQPRERLLHDLEKHVARSTDVEVLSCQVGAIKPEPAIYAHVLDGLQVGSGRVLFIGDTVRVDIEEPQAAGMKALHVDEPVTAMKTG